MIELSAAPPVSAYPGYIRLVAEVRGLVQAEPLQLMLPEDCQPRSEDWLVLPGMMLGMCAGEDVLIHGKVSPRLLGNLDELQSMLFARQAQVADVLPREKELQRIRVEADRVEPTPPCTPGLTISAFSAGLDSFHTALTYEEKRPLDGLLYVHGYEARSDDDRLLYLLLPKVKAAAANLGKRLFLVDGNFWPVLLDAFGRHSHSGLTVLAMIGHAMNSQLSRLVLPATYDEEVEGADWASLSAFAPLLSSEALAVEQHGVATRTEKARCVASSVAARRWLHVCWTRDGRQYNCGRCHKCVRTIVNLELAGVADQFDAFPSGLDLELVSRMRADIPEFAEFVRENLKEAKERGHDALVEALDAALSNQSSGEKHRSWLGNKRRKLERSIHRRRSARRVARHRRRHGGDHLFNTLPPADSAT